MFHAYQHSSYFSVTQGLNCTKCSGADYVHLETGTSFCFINIPVLFCEQRIWKQKVRERSITKLKWCPVPSAQQNIMICGLCTKWWWCIVKQSRNGAGFTTRWQMGGRWLEQSTRCSHYQYFHWISDLSNTDHNLTGVSLKLVASPRFFIRYTKFHVRYR